MVFSNILMIFSSKTTFTEIDEGGKKNVYSECFMEALLAGVSQ